MAIPEGWRNHLAATGEAIREMAERIERIAVAGRSPANHPLTPLGEEHWRVLGDGLGRIEEEFNRLMLDLAPEVLRAKSEVQPLAATRYHLSLALMTLEQEILDDIDPDQSPRRGKLESADRERIRLALAVMREQTAMLRTFVDHMSEPTERKQQGDSHENID